MLPKYELPHFSYLRSYDATIRVGFCIGLSCRSNFHFMPLYRAKAANSHRIFSPNHLLIRMSVCLSLCPVYCGKTADRTRMRFGMVGRMVPGMRQVVGFGDRFTGGCNLWGKCGAPHCNQWGVCGVARHFPNYSGESCSCIM